MVRSWRGRMTRLLIWVPGLLACLALTNAQDGLFDDPATLASQNRPSDVVAVSAQFTAPNSDGVSIVYVSATVSEGWHIYSVTQAKGGPIATKISLVSPSGMNPAGPIQVWPKPHIQTEAAWKDLPIETHDGEVVWYFPVRIPPGTNFQELTIQGKLTAQACNDKGCLPPKGHSFTARPGPGIKLPSAAESVTLDSPATNAGLTGFRQNGSHTTLTGFVEPGQARAGGRVRLTLTATPDESYHVYSLEPRDSGQGLYKPTLLRIELPEGWQAGEARANREYATKTIPPSAAGESAEVQHYYEGPVSWTVEVQIPENSAPGEYSVVGVIGYQSCYEAGCDRPLGARFQAKVSIGNATEAKPVPLAFSKASYQEANQGGDGTKGLSAPGAKSAATKALPAVAAATEPLGFEFDHLEISGDKELSEAPLAWALLLGFMGGLILNLMPCVLPVIGLKVLSFVEQSHHSRARVFALNVWYSLGLFAVFMVLASLAAFAGFGWGVLFKYSLFNFALAAVVFAMSLSFLGVWEIPIPGFAGSGKAAELAAQEGAAGAFAKGAITTVLATPCTGPFLGSALVWAAAKPPLVVYAVFASVGLGMASPYLLIGAFPRLIRWLPKPGAWMETFKQMMGFVLLGTIVYLLSVITPMSSVVPTLALLFGIWGACWWIGRHQWSRTEHSKLWVWGQAVGFTLLVGILSFTWLDDIMAGRFEQTVESRIAAAKSERATEIVSQPANLDHINWQPFNLTVLKELVDAQKTVMVDFTAHWCLTCKTLEATVLNTEPVRELLRRNEIVTLQAQWVDENPDTGIMLEKLKSQQIPVVAIFPAGRAQQPIVLRGIYPRQTLLDALEKAGPSANSAAKVATATDPSRGLPGSR